ncbi:MAG: tRNA lysidine(34) synthetase TilS [Candidatus Omnitrophica bacterium]|nr:tRNA lysidine(34) synthetase TilS [Candidatus Omnitrophota bacterium]
MNLTSRILKTVDRYRMLERGDRVLVGVSGGPDSVFLVHALKRLEDIQGIELFIAHMDHGLRGKESGRDAQFVKKLARSLGVKMAYKKLKSVKSRSKLSPEERLREKRYEFFMQAAKELGAGSVATAHTLDDQAETVLMRVIKGSSLKGVIGIHPKRAEGKIKFIRPLFEIRKKEILKYLKNKKISFRVDRTNLEDKFLRNRIRNKVMPYLEKINPRLKEALFNLAESLREDFEFIEEEKRKIKPIIRSKKCARHILLCDLLLQPKALQKEIAREALKSVGGNIKRLTYGHWKDIDNFVRKKSRGKSMDLPGGVKMRKTRDRLIFSK